MPSKLDSSPRLKRPDDVYQILMDAQKDMSGTEADHFRARLILLLANQVGDDEAVIAAIGEAAKRPQAPST
jgi:Protein of unknown function (DUF2783)